MSMLVFSLPSKQVSPGYSPIIWLNLCLSFVLPFGCVDLAITALDWPKVWSVDHHYLFVFLVCWKDWTSGFVSDASSVKKGRPAFHLPWIFLLPSFCICLLWHVPILLLKNSDFIVTSVWASFVLCFKQAQWISLVKILTSCQYLFLQKIVSLPPCPGHCFKTYCTLVISRFDLLWYLSLFLDPWVPRV